MLRGIARYARLNGPWAFFLAGDQPEVPMPFSHSLVSIPARTKGESRRRRRSSLLDLRSLKPTGVIGRLYDRRIARAVLASGLPVVAMDLTDEQLAKDNPLSRLSEIRPDSHKAGALAAEHLLERGFRHFAFCGCPGENWSRWREEGFCRRIEQAGFRPTLFSPPRRETQVSWHREQPAVTAWLASLPKPVGVMACNDSRGRQVIEACTAGGMHVPNDVAVVGVDEDHLYSELSNPPLSSVAFNTVQSGYRAAELLDGMMAGRVRQPQLILTDALWVVSRLSTDVIAVEDRDVAAALRYIRENARRPIGVKDVVKQSNASRRALEIRFQRSLGRSVREEVERVRINWIKQLLVETDLPAWKIAERAGFSSQNYLSTAFRRATGVTISAFRRDRRVS